MLKSGFNTSKTELELKQNGEQKQLIRNLRTRNLRVLNPA